MICDVKDRSIGEFGVYDLMVNGEECVFQEMLSPVNPHLAILYCTVFFIGMALIHQLVKWCHEKDYFKPIYSTYHEARVTMGFEVRQLIEIFHYTYKTYQLKLIFELN